MNKFNYIFLVLLSGVCVSAVAMQQHSKELSVCSVCQEPVLRSDATTVYGPQIFQSPPCVETDAHHDECMAQFLDHGGTCCPYCRAPLRADEGSVADTAPLSKAAFARARLRPISVHHAAQAPTADDLLAMALAGGMLPALPPPVVVVDLRPAFFAAVGSGNLEQIHQLITQGVDVNAVQPGSGKTALIMAAEAGNAAMVRLLIVEGHANCDVHDAQGITALMYAAHNGHVAVVQSLFVDGHIDPAHALEVLDRAYRHEPLEQLAGEHDQAENIEQKRNRVFFAAARDGIEPVVRYIIHDYINGSITVDESGFTPLMYAAQNGHIAVVQALVEHGDDLLLRNHVSLTARDLAVVHGHADVAAFLEQHEPQPPSAGAGLVAHLLFAARIKDFATVQRILVDHPMLINMRDSKGRTPLMCAVLAGDEAMVRFLIAHGANSEAYDYENFSSALVYAIDFRKPTLVRILVEEAHVSLRCIDCDGDDRCAEDFAREDGYEEIEHYLVEQRAARRQAGASPQPSVRSDVGQQLREAAKVGDVVNIMHIISMCPDIINEPDNHGDTAFFNAAQGGYLHIVQLLAPQVDVNYKNRRGQTALSTASWHGHFNTVRYLVNSLHADVTIRDAEGHTARDDAVAMKHQSIVSFLDNPHMQPQQTNPALINKDCDDESPIMNAIDDYDFDRVQSMVTDAQVDLNRNYSLKHWIGTFHGTPLMLAAERGFLDIVQFLILNGVGDQKRSDALIKAVQTKRLPIVQFLCTHGHVDPNVQDDSGHTILMQAAYKGDMPLVRYLVTEAHADPAIRTEQFLGITAYDSACAGNHPDVAEFLAQHGGKKAAVVVTVQDDNDSMPSYHRKKRCCTIL